jgi:hypothetical protein
VKRSGVVMMGRSCSFGKDVISAPRRGFVFSLLDVPR